jgi:acetyl/propionyl-CoA carboxylase alpha subunit
MLKAKLNNKSYEVDFDNGRPILNGSPLSWDLTRINDTTFHILHNNKSYSAELVQLDKATKTIKLKINGMVQAVELKDRYDLLLEKMGINGSAASKLNSVKAPMPGLIVKINVAAGDVVRSGDALIVLEAMKMENVIKSSGEATVSQVKIKKGDSVEKGQVLIEFKA